MRIPPCLRGDFEDLPAQQAFDLWVEGGDVMGIVPTAAPARGTVLSALVDAHVHLDKTYTVADVGAARGDLGAAITRSAAQRVTWTPEDVRRRMARALEDAWSCGTRAMRTHLDWVGAEPPVALPVFEQMRDLWRGRIELQAVALAPLDLWADAPVAQRIAEQVAVAAAFDGGIQRDWEGTLVAFVAVGVVGDRDGLLVRRDDIEGDAVGRILAEVGVQVALAVGLADRADEVC